MTNQPFDPSQMPSHPDYIRMVELVTAMEAEIDGDFNIKDYLSQYADPNSVGYIAMQRALGVMEYETPEQLALLMPDLMRATMLYTEGFILGAQFNQTQTQDQAMVQMIKGVTDGTD